MIFKLYTYRLDCVAPVLHQTELTDHHMSSYLLYELLTIPALILHIAPRTNLILILLLNAVIPPALPWTHSMMASAPASSYLFYTYPLGYLFFFYNPACSDVLLVLI